MPASLKNFFARMRSRWRGEIGAKPLIDRYAVETMLERSRIPAVLMLVLVWTVSSVLLILSRNRQYNLLDWVDGQRAPYSIHASVDFTYEDSAATARKREAARAAVPEYYREDDGVEKAVDAFFKSVESKTATAAYNIPGALEEAIAEALRSDKYPKFKSALQSMLRGGVAKPMPDRTALRIRGRDADALPRNLTSPEVCAKRLAGELLPATPALQQAFQKVLEKLIGPGNLRCDAKFTEARRQEAAAAVAPVTVSKSKGELLIRKGEHFTSAMREMIAAEHQAMPRSGWFEAYSQMAWSFFITLAGIIFVCMISTDIRRDNLRILLAGMTISAALSINYNSIKFFEYLLRNGTLTDEKLILAAVPVAFGAVVLSVVLDLRVAICGGGIVAVISAMMIMPHRSLELALRWTAIGAGAALAVRNVSNYRSFFVRTVLGVLVMTWALNLDVIFYGRPAAAVSRVVREATWAILGNAVFCAMLALLMLFVLELLFNLSTDMALMVLSDCNHPVLERLKREAPGTMAHSMAVATLAEDAARAIGANPLRAKVGALFHDIGKLSKPQYFTENNPDSSRLHGALTPQMSSRVIRDHVTDGVELANQYRLCRFIRGVISTHHGDDLVRFFYHKALEESKTSGAQVLEDQFRYHGEPPKTKEEGIISIADACEAASRSLKEPTPEKIGELVGNIIQSRFREGMLRNCRLTVAELDKLKKSFTSTLSSSMHGRIAYPGAAPAAPAAPEGKK